MVVAAAYCHFMMMLSLGAAGKLVRDKANTQYRSIPAGRGPLSIWTMKMYSEVQEA